MRITQQCAVTFTAAATLGLAACAGDLTTVNSNPNSATTAPAPALYTNAVRNSVARWLGTTYDQRGGEFVANHLAESQYPDEDAYRRLAGGFLAATFDGAYSGELEDLTKVIQSGQASNNPYVYAPASIMRTWGFGYLTDSWGDIPYFQALQGDSVSATLSPTYDKQKDIYADFFKVLAKASADLNAAPASGLVLLGTADPIYGAQNAAGVQTEYERFANSLRARFAMRLVNVDPTTAKAQFLAAMAAPGGLFQSNADNAIFKWSGDGVNDNPWATSLKTRDDYRLSTRLIQVMAPSGGVQDPRLAVFGLPVGSSNTYVGLDNALTQGQASSQLATTSRLGAFIMPGVTQYGTFGGGGGGSYPSYLMTYAEVELLLAEAAERGWIAGSAATHYNAGIQASMSQWGVTGSIAAYMADPRVAYTPGTPGLIQIATQKWIALFTDGGQAWAEWRRTCQPAVVHAGPTAVTNTVIRRFQYSTTETAVNADGVGVAVADQGSDDFLTRMYWDKGTAVTNTLGAACGARGP
jgi:hypothetical protein